MDSFNSDQTVANEQPTDQLTFKVGEREFNAESASKKIEAGDAHIAKIEQENKEFREKMASLEAQLAQSTKLEDALQKLNQPQAQESGATQTTPAVDAEKLSAEVKQGILQELQAKEDEKAAAQVQAAREATFKETQARLVETYGENVDKAIQEKAGVSLDTALKMAQDPEQSKILLKVMQVDKPKPTINPSSDLSTASFTAAPQSHKEVIGKSVSDMTARELAQYASNLSNKG